MLSSEFSGGSPGWMPRGACQGEDPELSFPAATGPVLAQVVAAKAVCFRCSVRAACLAYALATGQAGIWGGTTQEERRAMRCSARLPGTESTPTTWVPCALQRTIAAMPRESEPVPADGQSLHHSKARGTIVAGAAATIGGTGAGC